MRKANRPNIRRRWRHKTPTTWPREPYPLAKHSSSTHWAARCHLTERPSALKAAHLQRTVLSARRCFLRGMSLGKLKGRTQCQSAARFHHRRGSIARAQGGPQARLGCMPFWSLMSRLFISSSSATSRQVCGNDKIMSPPPPKELGDAYRHIVEAAVQAPSAENLQPWRFIISDDSIMVCLDKTRTLASDMGDMLSLTAIGACIENAVIAATAMLLQAEVVYCHSATPADADFRVPIARIRFTDGASRDPLADSIKSRYTNRRMDANERVDASLLAELQKSIEPYPAVVVHWVDYQHLRQFAKLVGVGNQIRVEHEPFCRELYENLRFSTQEAERTCDGLDVATLQLPRGVPTIVRMLQTWSRMKWANRLGFSRTIGRQAAKEIRNSGAVGCLTVPGSGESYVIEGGRALERMWLTATSLGLCFHPAAGLPVMLAHHREGGRQLTERHARLASTLWKEFYRLCPEASGRTLQMAFRVGYGPPAPARSLRRPLSDVVDAS